MPSSALTMALKAQSTPKKKMPSRVVMMRTMIVVVTVSLRVGQTTLPVSARTCRRNSPGLTFATFAPLPNSTEQAIGDGPSGAAFDLYLASGLSPPGIAARELAGVEGLEPTALGFGDRCSTS